MRATGRIARRPSRTPPSSASSVPPRTPAARKSRTRRTVASTSETLRAYWRITGNERARASGSALTAATGRWRASTRRPPTRALRAGSRRPKLGALLRLVAGSCPSAAQDAGSWRCWTRRSRSRGPAAPSELPLLTSQTSSMRSERLSTAAASSLLKSERTREDVTWPMTTAKPERMTSVSPAESSARRHRIGMPLKHAARTPRRGWCAAAAPRRRTRACGAGWRRRPRSCSWSRTGRSPRPPRAGAGGARRCARCA